MFRAIPTGLGLALLCAAVTVPSTTAAQGVPTFDGSQIAQDAANSARELAEQIRRFEQLQAQYQLLTDQFEVMQRQFDAISGITDLSDLSSRKFFRLGRTLDMLSYALEGTGDIGELPQIAAEAIERRSLTFGVTAGQLAELNQSERTNDRIISERMAAGLVVSGVGEASYDQSHELAEDAEELRASLGSQATLKQAVDHNSALLNMLIQIQLEQLRATSAQTMGAGADIAAQAASHVRQRTFARGGSD